MISKLQFLAKKLQQLNIIDKLYFIDLRNNVLYAKLKDANVVMQITFLNNQ